MLLMLSVNNLRVSSLFLVKKYPFPYRVRPCGTEVGYAGPMPLLLGASGGAGACCAVCPCTVLLVLLALSGVGA